MPMTVCVYLYYFLRNYFSKVARLESAKPAWKQNLTHNSHSGSFKVTHFGITEKLTTDCVTLYSNAGLISKVSEKIASKYTENCRCRQPHCRLMPAPREPPRISALNLKPPETRVTGLHFCGYSTGLPSFKFLWCAPKRHIFSSIECISAVQGHPRSLILAPTERAYATSY